MPRNYQY